MQSADVPQADGAKPAETVSHSTPLYVLQSSHSFSPISLTHFLIQETTPATEEQPTEEKSIPEKQKETAGADSGVAKEAGDSKGTFQESGEKGPTDMGTAREAAAVRFLFIPRELYFDCRLTGRCSA